MTSRFFNHFPSNKPALIGAIHLPPLLGYPDFPGFNRAEANALTDLAALEEGGIDAIIFENNYDLPHQVVVDSSVALSLFYIGQQLRQQTTKPLGVSVLWNDYKTGLALAKMLHLQFIRIPVFVDTVETACGIIHGQAKAVLNYRHQLQAEDVLLLTDIHVKHATLLSSYSLIESAELAVNHQSDALIITGQWTGQSPNSNEIEQLRGSFPTMPLLVGSGLDTENARHLFQFANGAIVSTSLKSGEVDPAEPNVKAYSQRISQTKVRHLVEISARS